MNEGSGETRHMFRERVGHKEHKNSQGERARPRKTRTVTGNESG